MSKQNFVLEASPRENVGKGASRRLRRLAEEIPAIIYGGNKDPQNISIAHKDILHAIEHESFFSQIITLKVGTQEESVVIKALQRHPAKPRILHADFQRVSADQPITVRVPLHFIDEDKCVGVKLHGGQISHAMTDLEVTCLPKDLPEYIEVFMAKLDVGDSIHISDLALPSGVSSVELSHGKDHDQLIVSVHKMQAMAVESESPAAAPAEDEADADAEKDKD